jgi:hypothetical protein
MADDALDELRRLVVDDRARMSLLLGAPDRPTFIARVMGLASELGLELSAAAVEEGLRDARRRHRAEWV